MSRKKQAQKSSLKPFKITKIKRSRLERINWTGIHWLFVALRYIGLRDRLRCPHCQKVGTCKPHTQPRRWLCKWCGAYEDIGRRGTARPCLEKKVWMLKPLRPGKTPAERLKRIDPWRG